MGVVCLGGGVFGGVMDKLSTRRRVIPAFLGLQIGVCVWSIHGDCHETFPAPKHTPPPKHIGRAQGIEEGLSLESLWQQPFRFPKEFKHNLRLYHPLPGEPCVRRFAIEIGGPPESHKAFVSKICARPASTLPPPQKKRHRNTETQKHTHTNQKQNNKTTKHDTHEPSL